MWAGDRDRLDELAPCRCCCFEHTFTTCPARVWAGCRGYGSEATLTDDDWQRFYAETRGMSAATFYRDGNGEDR